MLVCDRILFSLLFSQTYIQDQVVTKVCGFAKDSSDDISRIFSLGIISALSYFDKYRRILIELGFIQLFVQRTNALIRLVVFLSIILSLSPS